MLFYRLYFPEAEATIKNLFELAESGLRGKDLTDALHVEMFGHPPATPNRTPQEFAAARERFFALMDTMSEEELSYDILQGRPLNLSIIDGRPMKDVNVG